MKLFQRWTTTKWQTADVVVVVWRWQTLNSATNGAIDCCCNCRHSIGIWVLCCCITTTCCWFCSVALSNSVPLTRGRKPLISRHYRRWRQPAVSWSRWIGGTSIKLHVVKLTTDIWDETNKQTLHRIVSGWGSRHATVSDNLSKWVRQVYSSCKSSLAIIPRQCCHHAISVTQTNLYIRPIWRYVCVGLCVYMFLIDGQTAWSIGTKLSIRIHLEPGIV